MLSFLAPLFLAGIAAVAVPVFVHLIQRERSETVAFPSLMFLRQIPYKSSRRQKIRHWFLLLLRCLAVILLAAAFARPFLDRPAEAAAGVLGARELVILLDRSYSMEHGQRWARAVDAARDAVASMTGDDRASLVLFDASAVAVVEPTADRARLQAALDAARPGPGVTRYAPALQLAQRLLDASDRPRQEVLLISDFQRSGWDGQPGTRLAEGVTLTPVDVAEPVRVNVTVTGVTFTREYVGGRERVTVTARLTARGEAPVRDLPVSLELDGRPLQTQAVDLDANSATTMSFDPFTLPDGAVRGTVRAAQDALPRDDVFHFVLSPGQTLSVLVLTGPGAPAERTLFLRNALSIGDQPPFRVEVKPAERFAPGDVAGRAVVVLNDAPFPGGEAGRRLRSWVENGGGLLVVLGDRAGTAAWADESVAGFVGGRVGTPVDRPPGRGAALAFLEYGHPVFELFSAPRSGDFSTARFHRYRRFEPSGGGSVLARFDDGAVALAESRPGTGRVLVWSSTLDTYWNDLAVQPVFLPFVHQLARHAAGYAESRAWATVGQVLDLAGGTGPAAGAVTDGTGLIAVAPSGERLALDAAAPVLELGEQGFYELRTAGRAATPLEVFAVNVDPAESDLAAVDAQELVAAATTPGGPGRAARAAGLDGAPGPVDLERSQSFWWYLLLAAFFIFAVETVLANRLSRAPR